MTCTSRLFSTCRHPLSKGSEPTAHNRSSAPGLRSDFFLSAEPVLRDDVILQDHTGNVKSKPDSGALLTSLFTVDVKQKISGLDNASPGDYTGSRFGALLQDGWLLKGYWLKNR